MNLTLRTMLWKEWREVRFNFCFGSGFLVFFKLFQVYLAMTYKMQMDELYPLREVFALIAIIFCCIYGLIMGVGMFAMEYNTRTMPYLLTRPIERKWILSAKWAVGISQILVLGILGWVLMILPPASKGDFKDINLLATLAGFLLAPIPMYIISVFWSVILKDMTRATIISLISFVIGITMVRWLLLKIYSLWYTGRVYETPPRPLLLDIILILLILGLAVYSVVHFTRQQMK